MMKTVSSFSLLRYLCKHLWNGGIKASEPLNLKLLDASEILIIDVCFSKILVRLTLLDVNDQNCSM